MHPHAVQAFFVPKEHSRQGSAINAQSYNLAQTLLNRTDADFVFVPIREMQYLAVIEKQSFWFVDSLAYAVNQQEGGRMITVSWHVGEVLERLSLNQNIPLEVVFYAQDMQAVQLRLQQAFYLAMQTIDQRFRDERIPAEGARILNLDTKQH